MYGWKSQKRQANEPNLKSGVVTLLSNFVMALGDVVEVILQILVCPRI